MEGERALACAICAAAVPSENLGALELAYNALHFAGSAARLAPPRLPPATDAIIVTMMGGEWERVPFSPEMPVKELKARLAERFGLAMGRQRLMKGATELKVWPHV